MNVALLALLALVALASANLQFHIQLHSAEYRYGEALPATITVFNPSPVSQKVLSWATPLEGVRHDFLRVLHKESGEFAPYKGMLVKRGEPIDSAFQEFEAGKAFRLDIDLAEYYHFVRTGLHEVQLEVQLVSGPVEGEMTEEIVTSNSHLIFAESVNADTLYDVNVEKRETQSITYIGCSSSRKSQISAALSVAQTDARQAYNYLLTGTCTRDYQVFFGTVTTTRWNTVFSHFNSIVSALNGNNFEMDCSTCDMPGTYAYVYPFDSRKRIHYCEVFWNAPKGSHEYNSQPGTITHETSHFNSVAGTDDIQYGVLPCKNMANSRPNDCVKNADSHEFFQEMNPKC